MLTAPAAEASATFAGATCGAEDEACDKSLIIRCDQVVSRDINVKFKCGLHCPFPFSTEDVGSTLPCGG